MKIYKKNLFRFAFLCEIFIVIGFYFFGENGLKVTKKIELENKKLVHQIALLEEEIGKIEKDISIWSSNDFYKEKYSRERLQMAKEGDIIYFVK